METFGGSSSKDHVPSKAAIRKRGRSYKKLIMPSVHAVQDNDDLLIEILLRLPVISLFRLKSVCKRWLSLISNHTFTLRRGQISTLDPPCGLIFQSYDIVSSGEYDLLSFDTRIPGKEKSSLLKNPFSFGSILHNFKILQSCNGLLLVRCSNTRPNKYYIYNPCINLLKVIPQCSIKTVYGTKLAFDPTKSPHYKIIDVVYVDDAHDDGKIFSIQIQTYSSETNAWSVSTSRYPRNSFVCFDDGIYWNDALYWLINNWADPLLFKLDINVEHQTLTTIKTPTTLNGDLYWGFNLFETCGCLLLLCRYGHPMLMDVYERRKGYEWLVKYRVNLNDVLSPRRSWTYLVVYNIVLTEREEDSFIVMGDRSKIFQYKPMLKTSHDLYDLKSVNRFYCFQFIASFAGVGL